MYIINDPSKRLDKVKVPEAIIDAPFGIDISIAGVRYNIREEGNNVIVRKTSFDEMEILNIIPQAPNQIALS